MSGAEPACTDDHQVDALVLGTLQKLVSSIRSRQRQHIHLDTSIHQISDVLVTNPRLQRAAPILGAVSGCPLEVGLFDGGCHHTHISIARREGT